MPYPLNTVSPPVTQHYNTPVISKMRAAVVQQSQYATLQLQLFDLTTYTPVDLTGYGLSAGVGPQGPQSGGGAVPWLKFRFMEAVGLDGYACDATTQNVVDPTTGSISCLIPEAVTGNSGVYICEAGIFNSSNRFIFSNTFYVLIDRGLFTNLGTVNPQTSGAIGAPSLAEIRLNLRDNPEINRLIDEFEFDIADVCDAMVRSVMFFNMSQPPVQLQYNTTGFPWRYQWMDGIAAHLFECAANYYRRNVLKHQTGGLNVDDLNREQEYLQAWKLRYERWARWVQMKKVEINMAECFATFASPYSYDHRPGNWW